jgi:RNA recognition motif-containing protein
LKLFVGNLSFNTTDDGLRTAFEAHGNVTSAQVVYDRMTNRSRGFGFVEMANQDEAIAAMRALDGSSLDGRPLTVNEAKERPARSGGGGGRW